MLACTILLLLRTQQSVDISTESARSNAPASIVHITYLQVILDSKAHEAVRNDLEGTKERSAPTLVRTTLGNN